MNLLKRQTYKWIVEECLSYDSDYDMFAVIPKNPLQDAVRLTWTNSYDELFQDSGIYEEEILCATNVYGVVCPRTHPHVLRIPLNWSDRADKDLVVGWSDEAFDGKLDEYGGFINHLYNHPMYD